MINKKRSYVRQSESMHPSATEFSTFVHQMHERGHHVTRAMAIKWIISSYKREALIRFGAKARATTAIRAQQVAGERKMNHEGLTKSAVAFDRDGATITEREAESFCDSGISVVMQRLVSCRVGTYCYDKKCKLFIPAYASDESIRRRANGVVKKILASLSEGNFTAAEIAARCGVDVASIRNNLNHMRRAGAVEPAGKHRGDGRGKSQIVWRLKEAVCNLTT